MLSRNKIAFWRMVPRRSPFLAVYRHLYDRIKTEAAEIVDKELDRLRKDPVLCKLLPPEQGR